MRKGKRNSTGANRGNGEGILCSLCLLLLKSGYGVVVELDFGKSISDGVNIYAERDGDADFVFLARYTASPYIDNRPCSSPPNPNCANTKPSMSKRRRDWLVQRRGRGELRAVNLNDEITV